MKYFFNHENFTINILNRDSTKVLVVNQPDYDAFKGLFLASNYMAKAFGEPQITDEQIDEILGQLGYKDSDWK